jgi:hypothetical protein
MPEDNSTRQSFSSAPISALPLAGLAAVLAVAPLAALLEHDGAGAEEGGPAVAPPLGRPAGGLPPCRVPALHAPGGDIVMDHMPMISERFIS